MKFITSSFFFIMKTRQNSKIYEIGTCFFYMKCLYCAKITCSCDKSIKPNSKNRTKDVKYFRGCIHSLDDDNFTETLRFFMMS